MSTTKRQTDGDARPVTVPDLLAARARGQKLAVLTCYDFPMARLLDSAVDALLVGDSLGMVVQGHDTPLAVRLEDMIYHTRMVARGSRRALLITDMPFMTFQVTTEEAVRNAGRLVQDGGAQAVKLEGGIRSAPAIRAITGIDIPVMGHVGMTPQSVHRFGGFKVQRQREQIIEDALAVEEAGAFAVVLECIPSALAGEITAKLRIPTIGIGAGAGCDGQVLVLHDVLGLYDTLRPRFVKQYADLGAAIRQAAATYAQEVRGGKFPGAEHEFQ